VCDVRYTSVLCTREAYISSLAYTSVLWHIDVCFVLVRHTTVRYASLLLFRYTSVLWHIHLCFGIFIHLRYISLLWHIHLCFGIYIWGMHLCFGIYPAFALTLISWGIHLFFGIFFIRICPCAYMNRLLHTYELYMHVIWRTCQWNFHNFNNLEILHMNAGYLWAICMVSCWHICVRLYVCIHTLRRFAYVHAWTRIHTHTHTHTHTHVYLAIQLVCWSVYN